MYSVLRSFLLLIISYEMNHLQILEASIDLNNSCKQFQKQLVCTKHIPINFQAIPTEGIIYLKLENIDSNIINMDEILYHFPLLEELVIDKSNVYQLIQPAKSYNITVLKLRNILIEQVPSQFLLKFPKLRILDLRGNNLQDLPNDFVLGNLEELYLLDNHFNCSKNLSWIFHFQSIPSNDLHNLTCFEEPYNGKPLLTIAQLFENIEDTCPAVCDCSLPNLVRNPDSDRLEPIIEVNCSYRGLSELPKNLPLKTKILRLEGNEISDIKQLKTDLVYRKILDVYLDNNKIRSIQILEGSYWLKHFRVLSLNGNKIAELPTYAIDNALELNPNMPNALRISLGDNPWRCDCVFTPVFQNMLQKFAPQIQDISDIKCSYVEGDENSLLPIIELSRSSVCRLPTEYSVQALDLLNGILASLILLILGKLAYDYYNFKKTGRLPWIVTKMP